MHIMNFPCYFMIDHCYAVSGKINPLFSLITTLFTFMSFTFMYLFLENKNQNQIKSNFF